MKRTYFKGCDRCNATGFVGNFHVVPETTDGGVTNLTKTCPVCDGSGKILVTEES